MLNILQLQTKVLSSKEQTLNYIEAYLKKFLHLQPDIVTLPEMFNCPYNNKSFPLYAEFEGDITYKFCQNLAKKYNIYLSAGSIPEKMPKIIYLIQLMFLIIMVIASLSIVKCIYSILM